MHYYDTETKQFTDQEGENTILESDTRLDSFIRDIPTEPYIVEDVGGIPTCVLIPTKTEVELFESAKIAKISELKTEFTRVSKEPEVVTDLGFSVDGGYVSLISFQSGLAMGFYTIRDRNDENHEVTKEQFEAILEDIRVEGLSLLRDRWQIEEVIKACNTREELEAIQIQF